MYLPPAVLTKRAPDAATDPPIAFGESHRALAPQEKGLVQSFRLSGHIDCRLLQCDLDFEVSILVQTHIEQQDEQVDPGSRSSSSRSLRG